MTQAHRLFRIVLVIAALIGAPQLRAADMDPEQYQRYLHRKWEERVPRMQPPEPSQRERPTIKRGDRLPTMSPSEEGSTSGVTIKPRDARPPASPPASAAAPTAAPPRNAAALARDYLLLFLLVILAVIGLLAIIASLPRLARGIDGLFEPSNGEAPKIDPTFTVLGDSAPVDGSVDHQADIAAIRAMKEELEAQAAAARAAIEEALARAKAQKEDAA